MRDLDFAGSGCCDLLRSQKNRSMPARTERTLAVWALDIPKKERGLIRTISTRKRAMPVKMRYRAKSWPADFGLRSQREPRYQSKAPMADQMRNS